MKSTEPKNLSLKDEVEAASLSDEDAASFFIAREIMQEIRKFGVNQMTMRKLIELLALELEDRETMLAITSSLKGVSHNSSPFQ